MPKLSRQTRAVITAKGRPAGTIMEQGGFKVSVILELVGEIGFLLCGIGFLMMLFSFFWSLK